MAKQAPRHIGIETPLGADVLVLQGFTGKEELSHVPEFHLDLISENHEIKFDDIVGQKVTVRLNLPGGGERFWNGFINRFEQCTRDPDIDFAVYKAGMVPGLWFLTRTTNCRIFQEKKVPDIIKEVFDEHEIVEIEDRLSGSYPVRTYCVQYRETDFNFVSRLMEQEGIYYFFKHEKGSHTLVLCDSQSKHDPFNGFDELEFRKTAVGTSVGERILEWTVGRGVQSGKFVHTDYNFTKPSTNLLTESETKGGHDLADFEIYDFPGEYAEKSDGAQYAKHRMEEIAVQHEVCEGHSDARGICAGFQLKMKGHPRSDQNRNYLVTSSSIVLAGESFQTGGEARDLCVCSFRAIPADKQFRPPRVTPKPVLNGAQTAVVVGPPGEEIHTDEHGRVKVQFHWDREGQKDDQSSCFVRVAQAAAGKQWGAMFIPRIGQEALVEFLEGDPDQPLIVGMVYNAEQTPPYKLPDEKTKSTIKTNSSPGGEGFNEIRFDDKAGREQVFIHAERDLDVRVKSVARERVVGRSDLVVGSEDRKEGDRNEIVFGARNEIVHHTHSEHVGDMELLVEGLEGQGNQNISIQNSKVETVGGSHSHTVGGSRAESIGGSQSLSVGVNQQETVGANHALDAGAAIHLKAGATVVIEGGAGITLKAGGSFITVTPGGIFIQGPFVGINSGGAALAGMGSSPESPASAKKAEPKKAKKAGSAKTGAKSSG